MLLRKIKIILPCFVFAGLWACKHSKLLSGGNKKDEVRTVAEPDSAFVPKTNDTIHYKPVEFNGHITERPKTKTTLDYYNEAFAELKNMLEGRQDPDFKRAVFVTENAYFKEQLLYDGFLSSIQVHINFCKSWLNTNDLNNYPYADSVQVLKNGAIFQLLCDTIYLAKNIPAFTSYDYDFEDYLGEKNWSNQFVTKLMVTGSGNCHSMPYLYKILADELGAKAYLSLAPNHIYLKHPSKKYGWYNTELTSGEFPTDAWVKASGFVTLDAIRSGIYMDTLGQKQSVALCVYDLAKGYLAQTENDPDGFVMKCCDLVLEHYPNNINALLLKAETYRKIFDRNQNNEAFQNMQETYAKILSLGYREMPQEMYIAWLSSIEEQKEKYTRSTEQIFKTK